MNAGLHDAYAADYDAEVLAYGCHIADLLFGLCYEFTCSGQRLLDAGIGSGLSSALFAKAGLEVHGMDFSPTMLEICRGKGFATDLRQHDIRMIPWPYSSNAFDHLVCSGVMHFIPDLGGVIGEARRVLGQGGVFAFTTQLPSTWEISPQNYERQTVGDFEIFSHSPTFIESLLTEQRFARLKMQKCLVGEDLFLLWVARRE